VSHVCQQCFRCFDSGRGHVAHVIQTHDPELARTELDADKAERTRRAGQVAEVRNNGARPLFLGSKDYHADGVWSKRAERIEAIYGDLRAAL
jgi:hypothetical protein